MRSDRNAEMKRSQISDKKQPRKQLLPWQVNGPVQVMLRLCHHADNPNLQRQIFNSIFEAKQTSGNSSESQLRSIWIDIWNTVDIAIRENFNVFPMEQLGKSYDQNLEYAYLQLSVIRIADGFNKPTATERKRSVTSKICGFLASDGIKIEPKTVTGQLVDARARVKRAEKALRKPDDAERALAAELLDETLIEQIWMDPMVRGISHSISDDEYHTRPSALSVKHNRLHLTYFALAKHYLKLRSDETEDTQVAGLKKILIANGIDADPLMLISQFKLAAAHARATKRNLVEKQKRI